LIKLILQHWNCCHITFSAGLPNTPSFQAPHTYKTHAFIFGKRWGHIPPPNYSFTKNTLYITQKIACGVRFCTVMFKKWLRFSSNQATVLKMVSECVTYKCEFVAKKIIPDMLIAHHIWTLSACNAILWINIVFSADQNLIRIHWGQTQLHHQIKRVWGYFLHPMPPTGTSSQNSVLLHDLHLCVCQPVILHKCKCNSFVILDPFMPSQAKEFLDISNLTPILPRFLHVLLLSNMKPAVQKLFTYLYIVFPCGTDILGNFHLNWGSCFSYKLYLVSHITKNTYFNIIFKATAGKFEGPHNVSILQLQLYIMVTLENPKLCWMGLTKKRKVNQCIYKGSRPN